jgi:hypothetical protein
MKTKLGMLCCLVAALVMVGGRVLAHHGTASSYEMDKSVTVSGIVTEFVWSNPHCQLYFDVKDDKGNVVHWAGELMSPAVLIGRGMTRTSIKPGDQVTVAGHPSKGGAPVMLPETVKLADGKVFGRGVTAPEGPAQ